MPEDEDIPAAALTEAEVEELKALSAARRRRAWLMSSIRHGFSFSRTFALWFTAITAAIIVAKSGIADIVKWIKE